VTNFGGLAFGELGSYADIMIYARTPVAGLVQSDSEIDPYSDFRLDASYVTDGFIVWCLKSWLVPVLTRSVRTGKSTQEITH
jgi:hypothetical protein